jgi:hypothetical protein
LFSTLVVLRRRTPLDFRFIEGYRTLPLAVDEAVESDRPIHFAFGASAVGQETTFHALAANQLVYHLVTRLSFERRLPLITLTDPITLAIVADMLRQAYVARDNLPAFRPSAVAWFPQGERSLAYAAGAASLAVDARAASQVTLGQFGAEIAFLGEASLRRDLRFIANATTVQGQAVAFAMSENPIIGEELFAGSGYLDRENVLNTSSLLVMDALRWGIIIFGILLGILVNAVD